MPQDHAVFQVAGGEGQLPQGSLGESLAHWRDGSSLKGHTQDGRTSPSAQIELGAAGRRGLML